MLRRHLVSTALLSLATLSPAQTINITGTVVDSATNNPVAGATVKVAEYPTVTTTTSSTGAFVLTNSATCYSQPMSRQATAQVTLKGGTLTIRSAAEVGPTAVEVFDCRGILVYLDAREAGDVQYAGLWRAAGLYYVTLTVGSRQIHFSTLGTGQAAFSITQPASPRLAKSAASYTLQVSASTYQTRSVILSSLVTNAGAIRLSKTTEPPVGNPSGSCTVPSAAQAASVATADHVVGTGTPGSCTGDAFIAAVALGGTITFNCGPDPVTITLTRPAKVFNDCPKTEIVIDGGGKVTLSGGGTTRILYMNTCDQNQHWTTSHCDNQDLPHLTVQNLTFINGNSHSETQYDGGGAIWVRGGRFKAVNCRFFNNVCVDSGPDVGGACIRVLDQYNAQPIYITNCTFGGGQGYGNAGANGGALSSIGQSWTIYNSLFSYNRATGRGGNPASAGTPGGGSGGAIYNDGNRMTLTLCGCLVEQNQVNAYGSAIFFVSNDHTGNIVIQNSTIRSNIGGSWYPKYPGISMHDDTPVTVTNSTITQ